MVKISPSENVETNKSQFSVSRLLVSRSMFTKLKQELANIYGKITQKKIGTLSYLVLKSLLDREELSEFDFSEESIREVVRAIKNSPSEGRASFSINDTIITEEIYNQYVEDSFTEVIDNLEINDDIKDELKAQFDSVEELREANLESINGIGESTSEDIKGQL